MVTSTKKTKPGLFAIPLALIYIDLALCTSTLDPLNPVKLWGLSVVASFALADIVSAKRNRSLIRTETVYRIYALILFIFVAILFACLFFTSVKSIALFGDTGRNLGFLNYLFLALVALYTSLGTCRSYFFYCSYHLLDQSAPRFSCNGSRSRLCSISFSMAKK